MDKIEKIRQEIERRYNYEKEMYCDTKPDGRPNDGWAESLAIMGVLEDLLSFVDTLSEESEQPTMGYDEDYLNEKIAKASKSWKGVDVDKFMDEVRGREPDKSLEEAADSAALNAFPENKSYSTVVDRVVDYNSIDRKNYRDGFIAGAEWKDKQVNRDEVFHDGMRYAYDQLMKDAVEGKVFMSFAPGHNQMVMADVDLPTNTKVRIIVLPKEDWIWHISQQVATMIAKTVRRTNVDGVLFMIVLLFQM